MQLRRVLPLSLVALLASAGCVSVGPQGSDAPARGSVPPVDTPDTSGTPETSETSDPSSATGAPLPLGKLPAADRDRYSNQDQAPDPDHNSTRRTPKAPRPPVERHAKPAAPRRAHAPKTALARPGRQPAPPTRVDELCAAAEGTVPPSIVDLCIRQSGR